MWRMCEGRGLAGWGVGTVWGQGEGGGDRREGGLYGGVYVMWVCRGSVWRV